MDHTSRAAKDLAEKAKNLKEKKKKRSYNYRQFIFDVKTYHQIIKC